MLSRRTLALIFGLVVPFGTSARAEECFCLTNPQAAAILRGCEGFRSSKDNQIAACTDPVTKRRYRRCLLTGSGSRPVPIVATRASGLPEIRQKNCHEGAVMV
jgi:hypothetical protein